MPSTNSLHQTNDRLTLPFLWDPHLTWSRELQLVAEKHTFVAEDSKQNQVEKRMKTGGASLGKSTVQLRPLYLCTQIINQDPNSTITLIGRTHSYFTLFKVTFAQDHDYFLPVKPFSILRISSSYSSYHTSLQWLKQTQRMQWSEDASTTSQFKTNTTQKKSKYGRWKIQELPDIKSEWKNKRSKEPIIM